ncbi:CocE/NonD family hydrolase [Actinoplanes sp. GCM10030250]|uniref:CocE/NonD family hydrolase n=1 Tax=Actinoplanes sp. GCM10030250 TaxID=3273376 RepID=UPI0036220D13
MRQYLSRRLQALTIRGLVPGPHDVRVRRNLRVPMDDGTELLADLITPAGEIDRRMPTIVIRGPYGRSGPVAGQARALAREGFPVLFQSCRGTWGSGGVFTPQVDEQRDGIATHRWVRAQPWCTGAVATFGPSYMGFTQWAVAGRLQCEEPAIAPDALCLQVTMPDFGLITWDNAAFSLRNALGWTQMMDRMIRRDLLPLLLAFLRPDPQLRKAFGALPLSAGDTVASGHSIHWYQDWLKHERLTDEYWTQQSHTTSVPDVTAPVAMMTGWYDIFLPWQLRTYADLAASGRAPRLTVGPWGHVSRGMAAPTISETADFLRSVFLRTPSTRAAPVRAYLTGADQWHDLATWPPPGSTVTPFHLQPGGRLGPSLPSGGGREPSLPPGGGLEPPLPSGGGLEPPLPSGGGPGPSLPEGGVTSYVYDPADPTPAVGGPSLQPDSGPVDNAAHERRADVAVFRGEPLPAAVTVAGEPVAHIRFRSSAPSADIFVRLCDVHPDGRSMTVCDGIRRIGSIASSATDPAPDADGFRDVPVPLWPTFHRFAAGHRISVQVSSGAHPRYARNPGSGEPAASATTLLRATQDISHSPTTPSRLDLPLLPS